MGSCISYCGRSELHQKQIQINKEIVRAEIEKEMYNRGESLNVQAKDEDKNTFHLEERTSKTQHKKRIKRNENIPDRDDKKKNHKNVVIKSQNIDWIREQTEKSSLKEATQKYSLREQTQKTQNSAFSKNVQESDQQVEDEYDENLTETADNRRQINNETQIGNGLTEQDNELIMSTINCQGTVKLDEIQLNNKSRYIGQWVKGKRQGKGKVIWKDNSWYEGDWLNNKSHGFGKIVFIDGQTYEGNWKQNSADGQGIYCYINGSIYEGQWKNHQQNGYGIQKWIDGSIYSGFWINGKKNGKGKLIFNDGSYYEGQFNNNELHGEGIYCWKDKKYYKGKWQHNLMSGFGKIIWQDGQIYEGEFRNDKMEGRGVLKGSDGSCFIGIWVQGRKHGLFIETDQFGKTRESQWHRGKRLRFTDCEELQRNRFQISTKSMSIRAGSV